MILFLAVVVTLLVTTYSIVRTPSFQKYAGRMAASYLSDLLGSEVLLDKIRISDGLLLQLRNFSVRDHKGNFIIAVDELEVSAGRISLKKHTAVLRYIRLEGGELSLVTYREDSLMNIRMLLDRLTSPSEQADSSAPAAWKLSCRNVRLENMRFVLRDENLMAPTEGIDFMDMELSGIGLNAENFYMEGDSVSADILSMQAEEKSGFVLKKFSGEAGFSSRSIVVDGLDLLTNRSALNLDLVFTYPGLHAFNSFLDSVTISSTLRDCQLNLADIGYFAPELLIMDDLVRFSGTIHGTVSDFQAGEFSFDVGDYTHFIGSVSMTGLPDIYATDATVEFDHMTVAAADLERFALPGSIRYLYVPDILDKLGVITLSGRYSGVYNDFLFNSRLETALGNLDADIRLGLDDTTGHVVYAGSLAGARLNIGELLEDPALGMLDLDAEIRGEGVSSATLAANASLWIDNLDYRGQQYERIVIGGDFTARSFSGSCLVYDDALALTFDGSIDFDPEHPAFRFDATLDHARFFEMNLSDRSGDMDLKGKFSADFTGIDPDTFLGQIVVDSLSYIENGKEYFLERLELLRDRNELFGDVLRIRSDLADADADGAFSVKFLVPQVLEFLGYGMEDGQNPDTDSGTHPQQISFAVHLKNTTPLTDLFLEDLRISKDAHFAGMFDSGLGRMSLSGDLEYLSYFGLTSENIRLEAETSTGGIAFKLFTDHLWFREPVPGEDSGLGIDSLAIVTELVDDSLVFDIAWNDLSHLDLNTGDLGGYIIFPGDQSLKASVSHAGAMINGEQWRIEPGNRIEVDSSSVRLSRLAFKGENEQFRIDGSLSPKTNDTLSLSFQDWGMKNFNPFLSGASLELDGRMSGNIGITYYDRTPAIFSSLGIDSLELNQTLLGNGRLKSSWNDLSKSLMVNLSISPPGIQEQYKVLTVGGYIFPANPDRNFDLDLAAQNLQLAAFAPFLSSFSSGLKGLATGQATLDGTFDKPALNGKIRLQRTEMKIDYLNVTYTLSNELTITENAISFKDIEVYDEFTNPAVCSGFLRHSYFSDMYLDLSLKPKDMLAMNLSRYDNDLFYGTAFVSGDIRIYGPFEDLSIDLDVTTMKGTNVYIPISYSVDVSQSDFIVFTNKEDSSQRRDDYRVVVEGFKLNMGIGVRPEADVQIFLPSDMGFIKAKGTGDIRMGVDPRGYLNLYGTYVIASGLFSFTLEQLVSKRFDIEQGSKIEWDGDLNNAKVNIIANYRTKTSLSGLGITLLDPSSSDSKVNVVVRIYMTNDLFNPDLRFSVAFPNLDDQTRQTVYAVLDTTNMALMNQQAISLLVLNSFTYSGSTGASPINSTALIANSLSSMLSSVSNDFDIGINYIPGDDMSSEEIEVALSTQLFDDRLLIDGNFGVSTDKSTQKTSSIVGDVQVEYKLTSDGRFRVKAFNRSNDVSIIENDVPYTQGVGVFYRKDFDNLKELVTPARSRSEKKARQSREQDDDSGN